MIPALLITALLAYSPDSTGILYAHRDIAALTELCDNPSSREHDLMCRYRMYPLTDDAELVSDIPSELEDGSARELALLSGLWGYRAARASLPAMIRNGRRAERLLREAERLDPNDPFVLLVGGQSLLFKPRFAGGDTNAALVLFSQLQDILRGGAAGPITQMEADVWTWYAMERLDMPEAIPVRADLLAAHPPPLFRDFLLDPP